MKAIKEIIVLDKIETPAKKQHGGKRAGAGQPKGNVQLATIVKSMELADVQVSIKNMARKILNAQSIAALGTHKMVIITRNEDGTHVETVRDEDRMQELLEFGVYGKDYFIVQGAEADWKAGADMLNRAGLKQKDKEDPPKVAVNIFNLVHTSEQQHGNDS